MKVWQCTVCGYIHRGELPPEKCPVCNVPASKFKEIDEADIPQKKPRTKKTAPAGPEFLKGPLSPPKPEIEKTGLSRIKSLLIRHHAHPVAVHTPNGVLPAVVLLFACAWIFEYDLLAKAAIINLIIVVISLPVVLVTGVVEWQEKYNRALTPVFKIKILAAAITSVTSLTGLIWCLIDPQVISSSTAWIFMGINFIMLAAAGVAGHMGGKLVFKE